MYSLRDAINRETSSVEGKLLWVDYEGARERRAEDEMLQVMEDNGMNEMIAALTAAAFALRNRLV
jgi:hypothetical protein